MSQRWIVDPRSGEQILARKDETDAQALERYQASFRPENFPGAPVARASGVKRSRSPHAFWWILGVLTLCWGAALFAAGNAATPPPVRSVAAVVLIVIPIVVIVGVVWRLTLSARSATPIMSRADPIVAEWRAAEVLVEKWLHSQGEADAVVARATRGGGLDVESSRTVVRVDHGQQNVGGPAVSQLCGVAQAKGKRAVLFAKTGFAPDALAFAQKAGVELYVYGDSDEPRRA